MKEEIAGGDVASAVWLNREDQDAIDAEEIDKLGRINERLGRWAILKTRASGQAPENVRNGKGVSFRTAVTVHR